MDLSTPLGDGGRVALQVHAHTTQTIKRKQKGNTEKRKKDSRQRSQERSDCRQRAAATTAGDKQEQESMY